MAHWQRSTRSTRWRTPSSPRGYTTVVTANAPNGSSDAVARTVLAGARDETTTSLASGFPPSMFSLSHIALPFAPDDPLYGTAPDRDEDFGVRLGTLALRGETPAPVRAIAARHRMRRRSIAARQQRASAAHRRKAGRHLLLAYTPRRLGLRDARGREVIVSATRERAGAVPNDDEARNFRCS